MDVHGNLLVKTPFKVEEDNIVQDDPYRYAETDDEDFDGEYATKHYRDSVSSEHDSVAVAS